MCPRLASPRHRGAARRGTRSAATCAWPRDPSFARELVEDSPVEQLWAPWRLEYIKSADDDTGCIFCLAAAGHAAERLVLHRGTHTSALLPKLPYASGHLMVAPLPHVGEYGLLTQDDALELP